MTRNPNTSLTALVTGMTMIAQMTELPPVVRLIAQLLNVFGIVLLGFFAQDAHRTG